MLRIRNVKKFNKIIILALTCIVGFIYMRTKDNEKTEWPESWNQIPNLYLGAYGVVENNETIADLSQIEFNTELTTKLWVDIPNDYPWRKCVSDYYGNAASVQCQLSANHVESNWRISIFSQMFKIHNFDGSKCLEPSANTTEDGHVFILVATCTQGIWQYSPTGQLEWMKFGKKGSGTGKCMSSMGFVHGNHLCLSPCDRTLSDQRFEFGMLVPGKSSGELLLAPIDEQSWKIRQSKIREIDLKVSLKEVKEALEYKGYDNLKPEQRRAVVFYVDKSKTFVEMLQWWILAWKLLGLNSEANKFDIVMFVHPDSVPLMPTECNLLRDADLDELFKGPGKCVYKEWLGISHRDHRYDGYINSHECLYIEPASFLKRYSHLLRSDIDTFPTPGLVNSWPDGIIANKFMFYTFRNSSGQSLITEAIKKAAQYAGIEHKGWHDIGSTWWGPAHRILKLSKLTVALSRYVRDYVFGPGTLCRCSTCSELPEQCKWGNGIYAPTTLLYAQEIAMNAVWTEEEFNSMTKGHVDTYTTLQETVCNKDLLHLHVFHGEPPFSKFAFRRGDYKNYNMTGMDLTIIYQYSLYLALRSSGQGVGEQNVTAHLQVSQNGSLYNLCKDKMT